MSKKIMAAAAVLALLIAVLQKTPARFLSADSADFVWGLAAGLVIGTIIAWLASPPRAR